MKLGAYGGKLLGAGNGGFLLFVCSQNTKNKIEKKFRKNIISNISFDNLGSQIIYYSPENNN
jgi:D-glycero-alpha-D-manno-heptose-7-phosphate kinase